MKSILISIKPKYVAYILNGKKIIEIRKTMPKCDLPIDVYIYCTKDKKSKVFGFADRYPVDFITSDRHRDTGLSGYVVAKFTLNRVGWLVYRPNIDKTTKQTNNLSCLTDEELDNYLNKKGGYAWFIEDLVIFDKPKELSEFYNLVEETIRPDCPLKCKWWCITNYNCKYYVEDDCYGGQLACACPTKKVITKKPLTKAPQSWCYIESEE